MKELTPPIPPEDKLTPEFPGDVLPFRNGIYLRYLGDTLGWRYAKFFGGFWYIQSQSLAQAALTMIHSFNQANHGDWKWKGLNYDPQQS